MTKKRIADLLKEEVEKPADKTSATDLAETKSASKTEETTAGNAASGRTRKRSSAKASSAKSSSARSTTTKSTAAKTATSKAKAAESNGKQAVPDAALTKKIEALESDLAKSTDQIAALQEDVDTHQSRIFELKDDLAKAEEKVTSGVKAAESVAKEKDAQIEQLTAELEEAKQTILKLSASRTDTRRPAAGKAEASQKKAIAQPSAAKAPAKEPAKKTASGLSVRRPYSSYKSIPEYAIQRGTPLPGQNNSMMDDDDIGWVD